MNLQLVPKFKKYNRTQKQVVVYLPAGFRQSPKRGLQLELNSKKKNRTPSGRARLGSVRTTPQRRSIFFNQITQTKKQTSDYENECAVVRWCRRRKVLKQLREASICSQKQAEQWRQWKEREAEFARQKSEIEEQKRQIAKDKTYRQQEARRERDFEHACQISDTPEHRPKLAKDYLRTRCPYARVKRQLFYSEPYNPKNTDSNTYTFDEVYVCCDGDKKSKTQEKQRKDPKLVVIPTEDKKYKPKGKKYKQQKTRTRDQKIKKADFVEYRADLERSQKFVHWFYKACCQCFCWLFLLAVIGVAFVMAL